VPNNQTNVDVMTAVEWLVDKVIEYQQKGLKISKNLDKLLIEQAKEMEKQQIIAARITSPLLDTCNKNDYVIEAEQYYNEKFNHESNN
jgi:hypothetical protein